MLTLAVSNDPRVIPWDQAAKAVYGLIESSIPAGDPRGPREQQKSNLDAIVDQIAAITEDRIIGNIGDDQMKDDFATQSDRVRTEILAAADLGGRAVQVIVNAVLDALKSAVNAATHNAIGIAMRQCRLDA